jgi:hypothetical protein
MAHRALQLLANEPTGLVNETLLERRRRRRIGAMKAVVIHHYGGPEALKYGEFPDRPSALETSWSRSPRRRSIQSTSWSAPV